MPSREESSGMRWKKYNEGGGRMELQKLYNLNSALQCRQMRSCSLALFNIHQPGINLLLFFPTHFVHQKKSVVAFAI
jgi:hypothetical protein